MRPDAIGDEPHYLLAAQSMAFDGDLDLLNDYSSRERTLRHLSAFRFSPFRTPPTTRTRASFGRSAASVCPRSLLRRLRLGGQTGARLLMVLIAALVADQLFRLLRDLGFRRRYGVLAWAAVAFCYPMLVFSSQIYPELPAALLILVALRVMVRGPRRPSRWPRGRVPPPCSCGCRSASFPWRSACSLGLVIAACRAHRQGAASPRATGLSGIVERRGASSRSRRGSSRGSGEP